MVHQATPHKTLVWDTFKAVIRGVFISLKAYLNRKRQNTVDKLLNKIAMLEAKHKATGLKSIKKELDIKLGKLNLLEASQAAKSLLYAKQHLFEYRDRPNKQLANVLAQSKSMQSMSDSMVTINIEKVISMPDKLKVFAEYYNQL